MNAIKNAGQVLERTSQYLDSGLMTKQPSWYKVLAYHPPMFNNTKTVKIQLLKKIKEEEDTRYNEILNVDKRNGFYKTRLTPKQMNKDFLKPEKLRFVEDDIRSLFYKQHPWELADPKVLNENERNLNIGKLDWSTMKQYTKKLDGESVVQRTLYLVKVENMPLYNAYEQSKYEYYRLKIADETESSVTAEQSEMFGAVYNKSAIEYGFDKEMAVLSKWKKDAIALTKVIEAKRANSSASGSNMGENDNLKAEFEGENGEKEEVQEESTEEDIFRKLSKFDDAQN